MPKKNYAKEAAKTLKTALTGQIAFNIWQDKKIKRQRDRSKMQAMREAHLNYITTATMAAAFIGSMGLNKEYEDFVKQVQAEVAQEAVK